MLNTLEVVSRLVPWQYNVDIWRVANFADVLERTRAIPGSIVEGGVGTGLSLACFHLLMGEMGLTRKMWGYDSFEGFPETSEHDKAKAGDLNFGGIEVARQMIDGAGAEVQLVKGWFNETMPHYDGPPVAILHVDGDLYESTLTTLECFWDRMPVGGMVIFDEYDNTTEWPGESRAADEFFADKAAKLERDRFGIRFNALKLPPDNG